MDVTDLNAAAAHHYRIILHELHMAALQLNEDGTTALVELLNQEVSELLYNMHHGRRALPQILALKASADPETLKAPFRAVAA